MGRGFHPVNGRAEFILVTGAAFGLPILESLLYAFKQLPWSGVSNGGLIGIVCYEVPLLAVLGFVLRKGGWTLRSLGFRPRWSDVPVGVGLALASWCLSDLALRVLGAVSPSFAPSYSHAYIINPGLSAWAVAAVVLINPAFEELFVSGYVISALKGDGNDTFAVNTSAAIRLSYHLYQGVIGVLGILPLGLLCAYWFVRTRRLWPLIVAHAILDFVAFYPSIK